MAQSAKLSRVRSREVRKARLFVAFSRYSSIGFMARRLPTVDQLRGLSPFEVSPVSSLWEDHEVKLAIGKAGIEITEYTESSVLALPEVSKDNKKGGASLHLAYLPRQSGTNATIVSAVGGILVAAWREEGPRVVRFGRDRRDAVPEETAAD